MSVQYGTYHHHHIHKMDNEQNVSTLKL